MIGDIDALESLRSRLRQTEAIARLVAQGASDVDARHAFEGIAGAIEEQGDQLSAIIEDATVSRRA